MSKYKDNKLVTIKEAANYLKVSKYWLAGLRMDGDGPPFTWWGPKIRYRRKDLRQWVASLNRLQFEEAAQPIRYEEQDAHFEAFEECPPMGVAISFVD